MKKLAQNLYNRTTFRYAVIGVIAMPINIAAIWFFITPAGLSDTVFERNLAHLLGNEISILFTFHGHNFWTWRRGSDRYWKKITQFHILTGFTIVLRQIGFFLLDQAGYHWLISTIAPLIIAILINFVGYDKVIFKKVKHQSHLHDSKT